VILRPVAAVSLFLAALGAGVGAEEHVSVAAAANLVFVLDPLNAEFSRENPGVSLTDTLGASGSLVSQIENGAPFDVFLSADLLYPKRLAKDGGAQGSSLVVFAIGRLVLWTTRPGLELSSVGSVVRSPSVQRIAIANPSTAPYGRAAEEALSNLGLSEAARPKLVYGENISQAAQFVLGGNVDAGFVALSLVLSPKLRDKGRWLAIPQDDYAPIAQGGVLTLRGAANPAARKYLQFLATTRARAVFAQYGYGAP
jgi:molybdate transport system substrate-binding protein